MFNRKRIKEWIRVVKLTRPGPLGWLRMFYGLLEIILEGITRKEWNRRMQACYTCPVYDPIWKRCRPYTSSTLGCGCYTPYSNMVGKECWGRKEMGEGFGWGED